MSSSLKGTSLFFHCRQHSLSFRYLGTHHVFCHAQLVHISDGDRRLLPASSPDLKDWTGRFRGGRQEARIHKRCVHHGHGCIDWRARMPGGAENIFALITSADAFEIGLTHDRKCQPVSPPHDGDIDSQPCTFSPETFVHDICSDSSWIHIETSDSGDRVGRC